MTDQDRPVIPAPHHYAVFQDDDGGQFAEWLVGWRQVGTRRIVGLVLDDKQRNVRNADSYPNFVRYGSG